MENAKEHDGGRLLLLVANRENRKVLTQELRNEYELLFHESALHTREGVDLCIVDGPSLRAYQGKVADARNIAEPLFLPVLLLSSRPKNIAIPPDARGIVDDIVLPPVQKVELRARIETLLRARRLSLALSRMTGLYRVSRTVAERFQDAAMPNALPVVPDLTLSAVYRPAQNDAQIGGDWYDALRLADGRLVLSIGDVLGSGLEAAVAMANVRQVIRGAAQIHPDPAMMLDAADRVTRADDDERLVTVFIGVYDPVTSCMSFASAGHSRPVLRRANGRIEELVAFGLPLGAPGKFKRAVESIEIPNGSLLVLYTDGLTESTRDYAEGERRLREALSLIGRCHTGKDAATRIYDSVIREAAKDDVAILVAEKCTAGAGDLMLRWSFHSDDRQRARQSRDQILAELTHRALTPEDCFAAEVIFSELLGNVVRYAPGLVEIVLDLTCPSPVLNVLDTGPGFNHAARLPTDLLSESGRGLYIIAALSEDFSVSVRQNGGSHARVVLPIGVGSTR